MTDSKHRRVFGPVPSRRLGRSLGVDPVIFKTCSFDCIYCQLGRTTCKTIERKAYVPADELVEEVRARLAEGPRPDYVTMSGSGEPTLHAGLGDIIARVKEVSDVPVAVLTNGSLLYEPDVRAACARADLVVPSLDAGDEETLQRINRPESSLTLERIVEGLIRFREEYSGQMWLEVFLAAGVNDTPDQAARIRALCDRIRPERVQLNTAVRPTAEQSAVALSQEDMDNLCPLFGPTAEVVADFTKERMDRGFAVRRDEVLDMLRRRPCTLDDVAAGLSAHRNEVAKYVHELVTSGLIESEWRGEKQYFKAK